MKCSHLIFERDGQEIDFKNVLAIPDALRDNPATRPFAMEWDSFIAELQATRTIINLLGVPGSADFPPSRTPDGADWSVIYTLDNKEE